MINHQTTNMQAPVYVDINLIDVIDQPMPEQTQEKKRKIEASIKAYGLIYPIVAEKQNNGRYTVIEGRTRLGVIKQLGWTHVPCTEREANGTPDNKILSFDLELCRRHLSEDEQQKLSLEAAKILNSSQDSFREGMIRRLSPEMKMIFKKIESKEMTREWRTLFWMIGHLPHSDQRAFFDGQVESNHITPQPEIIDDLNSKIDELERQTEALRTSEKTLQNTLAKTKSDFKTMAAEAIRKKEIELEEKYREENLSDKRIKGLLEEERRKVAAEYAASMKESQQKLVELSKAQADTKKELEFLLAEKKSWDQLRKEDDLILKKRKDELEFSKKVIKTLAGTSIIAQQLKINLESLRNVKWSLTSKGTLPSLDNSQKEEIIAFLAQIKDNCTMITEALTTESPKSQQAA